jgi:ABC-2 type transport system permease protein
MKKRFFNFKLFVEALKQLRLVGIITFIITLLGSLISPLSSIEQAKQTTISMANGYPNIFFTINIDQIAPLLFVFMFLAPVLFVLFLFRFQNKRNSSDFFHSIPDSRISIFTSYSAAVLAWLYATIIAIMGIISFIYIVFVGSFNLNFIPYLLFTFLVGTTLVAGAALVAVSITGTTLTNITVTSLVLFLPRLVTFMMTYCIIHMLPNITIDSFGMFTNINYNIPLKFLVFVSPLSSVGYTQLIKATDRYTFLPAYFYTFAVAIILIALAGFFFTRRKSETAQKSAPDRLLQHVYRCAVTLPFTLLVTVIILSQNSKLDGNFKLAIICLILLSLFVYFIYELITTKKLANLVKAAPVFLVLVLINVIFCVWTYGVKTADLSFNPTAEEISSVQITSTMNSDYNIYVSQIKLTDPSLIEFVSETLRASNNSVSSNKIFNSGDFVFRTFRINLKNGNSVSRLLSCDRKIDDSKVVKALDTSAEYNKMLYKLPDDKDILNISIINLKQDIIQKIWISYKQEYNSLSDNEKQQISKGELPYCGSINISKSIGIQNDYLNFIFTPLTPLTSQMVMNEQNKANKVEMLKLFNKIINSDKFNHDIQITFIGNGLPKSIKDYNFNNSFQYDSYGISHFNNYSIQDEILIVNLLEKNISLKPDITKPFANINSNFNNGYTRGYYIALDDETINKLASTIPMLVKINNN